MYLTIDLKTTTLIPTVLSSVRGRWMTSTTFTRMHPSTALDRWQAGIRTNQLMKRGKY